MIKRDTPKLAQKIHKAFLERYDEIVKDGYVNIKDVFDLHTQIVLETLYSKNET